jgi:hypothetical protein
MESDVKLPSMSIKGGRDIVYLLFTTTYFIGQLELRIATGCLGQDGGYSTGRFCSLTKKSNPGKSLLPVKMYMCSRIIFSYLGSWHYFLSLLFAVPLKILPKPT